MNVAPHRRIRSNDAIDPRNPSHRRMPSLTHGIGVDYAFDAARKREARRSRIAVTRAGCTVRSVRHQPTTR